MAAPQLEPLRWDDDARQVLEKETIYLRERLRLRVEGLVSEAGRQRVTMADVEQARRMPRRMGARAALTGAAVAVEAVPVPQPEPVPEPAWPVSFGSYRLLDPQGAVAICTLASEDLLDTLAERRPPGVAMVGRAFTENLGVEKLVANLVANPRLRVLVLCGTESRHKVGETLLALHANGMDDTGRVIGSSAPLPVIRGLPPEAVRLYRQKAEIADLRGTDQPEAILARVAQAAAAAPPPWPECWEPATPVERLPATRSDRGGSAGGTGGMAGMARTAAMASMAARFTPDPHGFFLFGIGPSGRTIHAEHYTRDGVLDRRVIGDAAAPVGAALLRGGLLGDLGHAVYVGRELQKVELAIRLGVPYEQDRELPIPSYSPDTGS